jgi:hypothetical protein
MLSHANSSCPSHPIPPTPTLFHSRVEFDFLRRYFCEPDTWDNKCTAPIKGGPGYDTTEEWCISEYNAKDCKAVRDAAEEKVRIRKGGGQNVHRWVVL